MSPVPSVIRPQIRRPAALAVALVLAAAGAILPATAAHAATSYYVDCAAASNGSGSQASPWNNLAAVNTPTFFAGDQILLRRGTTCNGTLSPKGSGAAGAPIVIDTYGTGAKPHIAGGGAPNAVRLHNQQYWEIRNLEVTNTGATVANRRGVYITLQDMGTGTYYRITNLTVHHVNGDGKKDLGGSSGIHFDVLGNTTRTKFDDVIVDGNEIYSVNRSGINMSSSWYCRASMGWLSPCQVGVETYYPWTRFIVRNNTVHDIGGDGIVMQYTQNGLAEYNVAYDTANKPNGSNAAIWVWNADNVTFQFNEAYLTRKLPGNNDGMAWDADFGTDGTLYQYNYSHDNEGGMILYCGCAGGTSETRNATVRYNVSQNDKYRVIFGAGVINGWFYNNTIYLPPGSTAAVIQATSSNNRLNIANNIIVNHGTGGYSYNTSTVNFTNNILYGNHPGGPSGQITANPLLASAGSGGTGIGTVSGYRINAGSPAIGAGRVIPGGNGGRDYWGNPVPAVCAPDIGAHQRSTFNDANCGIVINGGFETGALSPWSAWNSASVVSGNARSGTYALRVGPGQSSAEQRIAVSPNTTYRLSGYGRVVTAGEQVVVGVKNYGGTETGATITATGYTNGAVTFTTGSTATQATIYCYKPGGTGYAYCDDITVQASPVVNGGFESGSLSPWYAWNSASVVSGNAHSGTYAVRVGPAMASAEQLINVSPNTTYVLSGWARTATAGEQVRIGVKNFGGTEQYWQTTATAYTAGSVSFTTGAGNNQAAIYCYKASGAGNGYCDDITVVKQ